MEIKNEKNGKMWKYMNPKEKIMRKVEENRKKSRNYMKN